MAKKKVATKSKVTESKGSKAEQTSKPAKASKTTKSTIKTSAKNTSAKKTSAKKTSAKKKPTSATKSPVVSKRKTKQSAKPSKKSKSNPSLKDAPTRGDILAAVSKFKGDVRVQKFVQAIKASKVSDIKSAIEGGVSLTSALINDYSALTLAAAFAKAPVLKLLLKKGAKLGKFPVLLVTQSRKDVVQLLLDAGADPNTAAGNKTALCHAIREGSIEFVEMLLEAGAKVGERERQAAQKCSTYSIQQRINNIEYSDEELPPMPPEVTQLNPHAFREVLPEIYQLCGEIPELVHPPRPWVYQCSVKPSWVLGKEKSEANPDSANWQAALDVVHENAQEFLGDCILAHGYVKGPKNEGPRLLLIERQHQFYFADFDRKLLLWFRKQDRNIGLSLQSAFPPTVIYQFHQELAAKELNALQEEVESKFELGPKLEISKSQIRFDAPQPGEARHFWQWPCPWENGKACNSKGCCRR